jgi:hypothetical protein
VLGQRLVAGEADKLRAPAPETLEFLLRLLRRRGRSGEGGRRARRGDLGLSEPSAERRARRWPPEDLGPLPAGRHGYSREQVAHHQRERLIAGLAEAVAERATPRSR